ncbi:DUF4190 domain-containing protein [Tautonia marina]|uniref:DUF4190 domain-containing protein n=1 Tax=Tautonia marina TaxID=2653855 RepID=UPI0012606162|nr:DUF4190 domain-containing protein [Tautonia marina]
MSTSWSATDHDYDPEFEEAPDKGAPQDLPTERLAVVSLVAGIAGFFLPVVGPVTAVVSGHVARGEIRKSNGRLGGDALAKTGLILGYIWIGLTVLAVLVMLSFTMVLVRSSPEHTVVVGGREFPAGIPHDQESNVVIQRLEDGRVMIEHEGGHGESPRPSLRIHPRGLDRSGLELRKPPAPPELPSDLPEFP